MFCGVYILVSAENNNLSFIEVSSRDSTNVEIAFQNILTGIACYCTCMSSVCMVKLVVYLS